MAAVAGRRFGRRHRTRPRVPGQRGRFPHAFSGRAGQRAVYDRFSIRILRRACRSRREARSEPRSSSGCQRHRLSGGGNHHFPEAGRPGTDDGGRPLGYGRHRAGRRRGYVLGKRLRDRADAFRAGDPDAAFQKRRDSQRAVRVFHRLARGAEEDFRRGTPAGASRNQLHDPGRGARRTIRSIGSRWWSASASRATSDRCSSLSSRCRTRCWN